MEEKMINNEIKENPPKKLKSLLVYKIVGMSIYALFTLAFVAFFGYMFIDLAGQEEGLGKGLGAAFMIIFMIIGAGICALVYLAPIILGIIGLVKTVKQPEKDKRKWHMAWFIIMISAPVVTVVLEFASVHFVKLL